MKRTFLHRLNGRVNALLLIGSFLTLGDTMCAQAQQAPKPVFTLDFSDGSNAKNAQGEEISAQVEGKFSLQDSPHGKAMLSGPGAGYLHFPAKNIINSQSGTVEMWVSPQDWNGEEKKFHAFSMRAARALYTFTSIIRAAC